MQSVSITISCSIISERGVFIVDVVVDLVDFVVVVVVVIINEAVEAVFVPVDVVEIFITVDGYYSEHN